MRLNKERKDRDAFVTHDITEEVAFLADQIGSD